MEDHKGMTALQYALKYAKTEIVELFLGQEDIDIYSTDNLGRDATYYEYLRHLKENVMLILSHPSFDINKHDAYRFTLLHKATSIFDIKMVNT